MGATLITSREVKLNDLESIEMPEATKSYVPVSHYDLAMNVGSIGERVIDKELHSKRFGLARKGQHMFATYTFKNDEDEVGMSIGFRNSYDKSMSIGVCVGAKVFVCENLMMTGEVTFMRKHTGNILDELNSLIFNVLYKSDDKFAQLQDDKESMKEIPINNQRAWETMGVLFGKGIINTPQISIMKKEWKNPSHDAFDDDSLWSLYNAGTEALKTCSPTRMMSSHIKLHRELTALA